MRPRVLHTIQLLAIIPTAGITTVTDMDTGIKARMSTLIWVGHIRMGTRMPIIPIPS